MRLLTEPFLDQQRFWPASGREILAQYDADTVVVYQAFCGEIAAWACEHQRFGGAFSLGRMSWIKPNFLWMMYRSGWATKAGQEHVLALHLRREGFEQILAVAVASTWQRDRFATAAQWQAAVDASSVRLQWDPDHSPAGQPLQRRAIQLGLRGAVLRQYAEEWITQIEDITSFVLEQRAAAASRDYASLITPRERCYRPLPAGASAVGLSSNGSQ